MSHTQGAHQPAFSTDDLIERDSVVSALHHAGYDGFDGGSGAGAWDAHLEGPGFVLAVSGDAQETLPYSGHAIWEPRTEDEQEDPAAIATFAALEADDLIQLATAVLRDAETPQNPAQTAPLKALGALSGNWNATLNIGTYVLNVSYDAATELPYSLSAAAQPSGEQDASRPTGPLLSARAANQDVLLSLAQAFLRRTTP